MAEHRVPMLGAALRRASLRGKVDPEHSSDPKVRELVAALSTLEVAPAPRADFRSELRAQLVAVAPRLIAEGDPSLTTTDERAEQARRATQTETPRHGFRFARPLIAAACILTAFVILLGGAVWISKKALPGDSLYGLKRASENTEYNLTGGTVDKAKLKLEFARNRLNEVAELLPRASAMGAGVGSLADGGVNTETASLIRSTLASADGDVKDASAMLTQVATRTKSAGPLNVLIAWAPPQLKYMTTSIVPHVPTSNAALLARVIKTWKLIDNASKQAQNAAGKVGAKTTTPTTPKTSTPSTPAKRSTAPGSTTSNGGAPPATTGTSGRGTTTHRTGGGAASSTAPAPPKSSPAAGLPTSSVPGRILPSGLVPSGLVPTTSSTPKLPISIDSCGVHASLGPLDLNLGSC